MTLIWVVTITLVLFSVTLIYYFARERKSDIIVNNYDQSAKLDLGKFFVLDYKENDSSYFYSEPKVTFSFSNKSEEKDFLEKISESKAFLGMANYLTQNNLRERNYLFQSENSYYTLHRDSLGKYFLYPTYSVFMNENEKDYNQYRFICPFNAVFDNNNFDEIQHQMSEQEFFEFYTGLSNDLVKIDYNSKSVYIKAFDIYNSKTTDDFPIKINYQDDKLKVTYLSW